MTEIRRGTAVRSRAGHDRGRWFAVLGIEGKNALISDGENRPIEKPKKKNIMHLSAANTVFDEETVSDNTKLKKALKLRFGGASEKGDD